MYRADGDPGPVSPELLDAFTLSIRRPLMFRSHPPEPACTDAMIDELRRTLMRLRRSMSDPAPHRDAQLAAAIELAADAARARRKQDAPDRAECRSSPEARSVKPGGLG